MSRTIPFIRSASFLITLASAALGAALVPIPTAPQPALPAPGLEVNQSQAKPGILFLCPGATTSLAVTAQSVLYSPLGAVLSLVASDSNPQVSFSDPLPGLANSYTGANSQQWVTGIARYGTAILARVYPGVNVRYTVDGSGTLTLSLLLSPGVDPGSVHFQIPAATSITVSSNGSLTALFGTDEFIPAPLLSYTAPAVVQSSASGNITRTASFSLLLPSTFNVVVQGIDSALPTQISIILNGPTVFSSTAPRATTQVSDAAGNSYFAATIADAAGKYPPFPTIAGVGCGNYMEQPVGCSDVAVYKYSSAGVLQFVTYLSGQTDESASFIGLATDGSLVVAGTTNSVNFPVTSDAAQPTYAGPAASPNDGDSAASGDFFAVELDASGFLQAGTFLGGPNADTMGTAALGSDGSLYFLPVSLGHFSTQMPVTSGALLSSCQSDPCQNGYVARLSPALDKLIFGSYLPGTQQATAQLYSDGSVYYAGTASAGFPTTPNAYQTQNAGGYDGILARLDPTGSKLIFATYFGGPNTDWILTIAVAPDGSVWAGVSSFLECCVNIQAQLIHLDASGSRLLAVLPIYPDQMVVDAAGDVFTLAEGLISVSPNALLGGSCGGDAYVELNSSGQQLFATYLPAEVNGFAGADAQGTPYLVTPSGLLQVVQGQPASTAPFAGCVVDAASFTVEQAISPGQMVTIFGSGLGPTPGVSFQLVSGQVPTSLSGTQVLVNGEQVPILYSSYGQLNLILPYSLAVGAQSSIEIVSNQTSANELSGLEVQAAGVTIFQVNGAAVALNQDGTMNSPQNPAQPGSTVMLFGTGGGQTNPPSVAGGITPLGLRSLIANVQVEIAYSPSAPIVLNSEYTGAAPELLSGVTQVNVTLPDVIPVSPFYPPETLPLFVRTNGQLNQTVTIFVATDKLL
jgi:uncharacterized protein (TIGR03437 family)